MWNKFKSTFLADLKIISLNYRLLVAFCVLILLIILTHFCFPVISHSTYLKYGMQHAKYHTLISITLVTLIPVLTGIAYGKIISDETHSSTINGLNKAAGNIPVSTYIRIFSSLVLSFLLIILSIWLIKPVPSQGWLRTLYAAILLSVQTPFILLLLGNTGYKKVAGYGLKSFCLLVLIALPLGLLVHHPWNYFAFFSPFYWVAWAWMINPITEAIICGSIALVLSSAILFILLKYNLRRHPV